MDFIRTVFYLGFFCSPLIFINGAAGDDYLPEAVDVRWESYNFKTLLMWGPKPTNHTYTVEFSEVGEDRRRTPHCIRSSGVECDLTNELRRLGDTYVADVVSEPLPGMTSDLVEFPFTRSPRFCPYTDTDIGKPEVMLEVGEDKTSMVLQVSDPPTPLYRNGRLLSIRDVLQDDLSYKVIYSKAASTGKKEKVSSQSRVVLSGLDRGVSYCFRVAAYIPSRKDRKLGEWSRVQCSPREDKTLLEEFSVGVIAGAIFIMVLLLLLFVFLCVLCCKRCCCRKNHNATKDLPLTQV